MGPLPFHVNNLYLIFNPITGLISQQYQISFDDFFETILYQDKETSVDPTWKDLAGLEKSLQGKLGRILHTLIFSDPNKPEKNHMIPENQPNNDPTSSIIYAQTPLPEAVDASDRVDAPIASANDLNDSTDHEPQGSFQEHHHPLSNHIVHDEAKGMLDQTLVLVPEGDSGLYVVSYTRYHFPRFATRLQPGNFDPTCPLENLRTHLRA